MTGLVSFSLFGDDSQGIYRLGALENARAYLSTPETICRFYVGQQPWEWACEHLGRIPGVELVKMPGPENQTATLWRFQALRDTGYDYYLFRDTDSRPIARERAAVAEWLSSDKAYHVMRDHPYHNVPMMAGLWGVKPPDAQRIGRFLPLTFRRSYYQVDQMLLKVIVWKQAKYNVLSHSGCGYSFGEEIVPFPSEGDPSEGFVGEGFYGDGRPRFPEHNRVIVG